MATYSVAVRSTNITINNAVCEIYTPATLGIRVMEVGICQLAAAVVAYGLGRPAAVGVTPGTTSLFQAEQSTIDPAAKTNIALSWGTSPTAPLVYLRRCNTALAASGAIWTFPRGLYVPPSSSLVIFNITAGSAADIWFVIDE
jgi:hypothetical protein